MECAVVESIEADRELISLAATLANAVDVVVFTTKHLAERIEPILSPPSDEACEVPSFGEVYPLTALGGSLHASIRRLAVLNGQLNDLYSRSGV